MSRSTRTPQHAIRATSPFETPPPLSPDGFRVEIVSHKNKRQQLAASEPCGSDEVDLSLLFRITEGSKKRPFHKNRPITARTIENKATQSCD